MEIILFDNTTLQHIILHCVVAVVMWVLVIAAILVDLWDGVYTAHKIGEPIHSNKLRVTGEKIAEYWRLLLIGFIIDSVGCLIYILGLTFYALPFISVLLAIGLVGVEGKSMWEHMKRRKSKTVELKKVLSMIVDCATEKDAKDILEKCSEYLAESKRLRRNEGSD